MLNPFILFRAAMNRPGDLFPTDGRSRPAASPLTILDGVQVLALVLTGYAALAVAVLLSS